MRKDIAVLCLLFFIVGCGSQGTSPDTQMIPTEPPPFPDDTTLPNDELACDIDDDCNCGVHVNTGECFFGNRAYVDDDNFCPDFCPGLNGQYAIKCVDNTCQQVVR